MRVIGSDEQRVTETSKEQGDATDCFPFKLGAAIILHDRYVPGGGVGASTCLGRNFDSTQT